MNLIFPYQISKQSEDPDLRSKYQGSKQNNDPKNKYIKKDRDLFHNWTFFFSLPNDLSFQIRDTLEFFN